MTKHKFCGKKMVWKKDNHEDWGYWYCNYCEVVPLNQDSGIKFG